jgi:hypothetical protein
MMRCQLSGGAPMMRCQLSGGGADDALATQCSGVLAKVWPTRALTKVWPTHDVLLLQMCRGALVKVWPTRDVLLLQRCRGALQGRRTNSSCS